MSEPIQTELHILAVGEPEKIPNKTYQKLGFDANAVGYKMSFLCFKQNLFDRIKIGEKFIGMVEIQKKQNTEGIERVLVDIVSQDKSKNESIEAQVAVKAITDLECADKITDGELKGLRDTWCLNALKKVVNNGETV